MLDLEASQRQAALDQLESRDPDLAVRVRSLLARNDEPGLRVQDLPIASVAEEFGLTSSPTPGTLIGQNTVVRSLGSGGMGSVYEATDHALGRSVAVKVIHPAIMSGHALRDFEHEAKLLARQASQDSLAYGEKLPSGNYSAYFRAIWAQSLRMQGDPLSAETLVRPLIAARVGLKGGVWVDGFLWLQLGDSLMDQNRVAEAAQALDNAESYLAQLKNPTHPMMENLSSSRRRLQSLQQPATPAR